jgi:hypothetical protein
LRGHIASSKPRSFRRAELEEALKPILNQQIRFENRMDRKERAA